MGSPHAGTGIEVRRSVIGSGAGKRSDLDIQTPGIAEHHFFDGDVERGGA